MSLIIIAIILFQEIALIYQKELKINKHEFFKITV